ncbi:hypothetical protein ACGF5O_21555 [Streptomyces sp. NPDC048291]|uniref:hypothetical protein n=1 Tax=Streptomyces sp. NPDC048291 TaxID=3365530 RepID=UPI00371375E9
MNAENGRAARNGVVLGAAKDCPGGQGAEEAPPVRLVDRTDSRERAVLMGAFSAGNALLADDRAGLGAACATVVRSAQRVESAIAAVDRFRRIGGALPAVRETPVAVVGETAGAEDAPARTVPARRPRVAGMWRRLVWPVTGAGAVFDAAFMGSVIQQILDVDTDSLQYWLAYLPGVAIAVCLLAAGTFLAERTAAVREARAEAGADRGGRYWWRPLVVPWLLTLALLGLIVVCGVVRVLIATEESEDSYLALFQPVVVVLLLLLGAAAVATKLLSHDPEAASDAEEARLTRKAEKARRTGDRAAEKALRKRMKAADELGDEAREALVGHVTAWFALKASLDGTELGARRHVEDAATGLVEERARTGMAGTFEFPLRAAEWPPERVPGIRCAPRGVFGPAPSGDGPRIRLDLLAEARAVLEKHRPDDFSCRLDDSLGKLNRQWGDEDPSDAPADDTADAPADDTEAAE